MGDLATRAKAGAAAITPVTAANQELQAQLAYAHQLAASDLLPAQFRQKPANVLWALAYARMLDVPEMVAMTGINVIQGKPTSSADLIAGLVRRAGHKLRVSDDGTKAIAEITRSDDPEFVFRSEWDMARAKAAGLADKSNWKTYPAAMRKARAITEVAREACSEALYGIIYTAEELGAVVDEDGVPVKGADAEPVVLGKTAVAETAPVTRSERDAFLAETGLSLNEAGTYLRDVCHKKKWSEATLADLALIKTSLTITDAEVVPPEEATDAKAEPEPEVAPEDAPEEIPF